jgi:hypothetical protein
MSPYLKQMSLAVIAGLVTFSVAQGDGRGTAARRNSPRTSSDEIHAGFPHGRRDVSTSLNTQAYAYAAPVVAAGYT